MSRLIQVSRIPQLITYEFNSTVRPFSFPATNLQEDILIDIDVLQVRILSIGFHLRVLLWNFARIHLSLLS